MPCSGGTVASFLNGDSGTCRYAAPFAFRGSVAGATACGALPANWCESRRRASGAPASMLAHRLPIRCLLAWSLRSRRCFAPAHFRPQNSVGGENGRSALSGGGFAAIFLSPSRPRRGCGERKGERYRGVLQIVAAGHSMLRSYPDTRVFSCPVEPLPCPMPPRHQRCHPSGHGLRLPICAIDR